MWPDSNDPAVGFEYIQTIMAKPVSSGTTFFFAYKDWINSLVLLHPSAGCVTNFRAASTTNSILSSLDDVPYLKVTHDVQPDGTVLIEYLGDETVPRTLNFYLIGSAYDGSRVSSPQMTFKVECGIGSSTVSHPGGMLEFNFDNIIDSYSF